MRNLIMAMSVAAAAVLAAAAAAPPAGNETINYSYDARGRLTNVTHSGSVNNNVVTNYTYDKADNRVTVNVTGAP
jgi:YD repeat-containing protein